MNKRYRDLQKKRAELVQEAEQLVNLESPTEEQSARADEILKTDIPKIDAELDRFEALFEAERRVGNPAQVETPAEASDPAEPRVTRGPITVTPRSESDPWSGFADAADFGLAVHAACSPGGRIDTRLGTMRRAQAAEPSGFHQEGHSDAGYLVPPAMRDEIWQLVFESDDLLAMVNPEPTGSNSVEWLGDESTPWGSQGILSKWRAEGTKMEASKLLTEGRDVKLHELYTYVTATDELLADTPRLRNRLGPKASQAMTWKASEAVMRGTGAGQPLGWENSAALLTVPKEQGQAAGTIVAKNVTKMYSRLLVTPGARPTWLANRDIVPELVDLKIGDQPIWVAQNQGLRQAPEGLLLGIPIRFTEHAETLGTAGDLQLNNLAGYYATVKRGGVKFDSSIHLFFDHALTAFRWMFRLGGQPFLSKPVSPPKGADRSHFVYLATRA